MGRNPRKKAGVCTLITWYKTISGNRTTLIFVRAGGVFRALHRVDIESIEISCISRVDRKDHSGFAVIARNVCIWSKGLDGREDGTYDSPRE